MAKAKLNPLLSGMKGSIGRLTVRETPHGTVVTRKGKNPEEWSAKQKAQRLQLKFQASNFYWHQMSDPEKAAHYRARAKERRIPVSAFVMGGFMKHGAAFAEMEAPHQAPGGETAGRDGADVE